MCVCIYILRFYINIHILTEIEKFVSPTKSVLIIEGCVKNTYGNSHFFLFYVLFPLNVIFLSFTRKNSVEVKKKKKNENPYITPKLTQCQLELFYEKNTHIFSSRLKITHLP